MDRSILVEKHMDKVSKHIHTHTVCETIKMVVYTAALTHFSFTHYKKSVYVWCARTSSKNGHFCNQTCTQIILEKETIFLIIICKYSRLASSWVSTEII